MFLGFLHRFFKNGARIWLSYNFTGPSRSAPLCPRIPLQGREYKGWLAEGWPVLGVCPEQMEQKHYVPMLDHKWGRNFTELLSCRTAPSEQDWILLVMTELNPLLLT